MKRLILAAVLLLAAGGCYDKKSGLLREQQREMQAAVMAQGFTDVSVLGPAFNCARRGAPRMIGSRNDGWMTARVGGFFTARRGATRSHHGFEVRGMVCVGRSTDPSVLIFPERPR